MRPALIGLDRVALVSLVGQDATARNAELDRLSKVLLKPTVTE